MKLNKLFYKLIENSIAKCENIKIGNGKENFIIIISGPTSMILTLNKNNGEYTEQPLTRSIANDFINLLGQAPDIGMERLMAVMVIEDILEEF